MRYRVVVFPLPDQFPGMGDLFAGKRPNLPLIDPTAFKKAQREDTSASKQTDLDL